MVKQISCTEAMSKLQAYLDREVGAPTEAEIDHHLEHCRECFSRADFEKALRKKVEQAGSAQAPQDVKQRMAALIRKF